MMRFEKKVKKNINFRKQFKMSWLSYRFVISQSDRVKLVQLHDTLRLHKNWPWLKVISRSFQGHFKVISRSFQGQNSLKTERMADQWLIQYLYPHQFSLRLEWPVYPLRHNMSLSSTKICHQVDPGSYELVNFL